MKRWIGNYIGLVPGVLFLLIFFIYPLSEAFFQSFGYFPAIGINEFSLVYYKEIFSSSNFKDSMSYTLYYSVVSALLATGIGVLLSLALFRSRLNPWFASILKLPILLPHLVVVTIIYLLFSQTGIFSRIAFAISGIEVSSDFPILVQDSYGIGVIIAYLFKGIPFVISTVVVIFQVANARLYHVAENLGARGTYIFFHVLLPLALPNMITSFLLLLSYSMGDFEVPLLLGATSNKSLSILSYQYYISPNIEDRIYSTGINMVLLVLSFLFLLIYIAYEKRSHNYQIEESEVTESRKKISLSIKIYIAMIMFSILPVVIWSVTNRWKWPLLLPEQFGLRGFNYVLSPHANTLEGVLSSVTLSFFSTMLVMILSVPMARTLGNRKFRGKGLIYAIIWAPFLTPIATIGMSLYRFTIDLGIDNHVIGVVIANTIIGIPYAMLILRTPASFLGEQYHQQAELLGSNPVRNFFCITLPALSPAIKRGFVLVYMITYGQYFLTFLIGGGQIKTLPILMFPFIQQGDRMIASVYALIFIVTLLIVLCAIENVFSKIWPYSSTRQGELHGTSRIKRNSEKV